MLAQTSPKGTFRIETGERIDEDPTIPDPHEQQFIVSTADSKVREPLGEERQAQPATYFISPDEQWIFADVHYGSGMGGAHLYQRKKDLKFERVIDEDQIWKFFEKQALAGKERPSDWDVHIVDFIAWSPDSARVLFSLRTGMRVPGKGSLGYYGWHAYYNVRTGKFEVTDYLRALTRSAHKIRPEDQDKGPVSTAASAEPLADLPPETELRKRAEEADRREKKLYEQIVAKVSKEQAANERDAQRDWSRTREPSAKFYAKSGPKATAGQRYWQYMLDSAENRLKSLESYYGFLVPPPEQAWDHFAGIWRGDTAADVKKLFGDPMPNEANAGPELRYFDGALVITCDKQTQRVKSVCLDLSTETFRMQWRAASAKRHLYELQWDWSGENYESLRKLFGPKLEKHSTERGEAFNYAYSPRTTVSCHPDPQDGNCSAMCVLWNHPLK
ncbi:MAG TPA: hypothetical protein VFU37_12815 [Pyrinomonadaceae bacterium]|nr:hypothetical protein [Pyrinomonadaceae bacterium]